MGDDPCKDLREVYDKCFQSWLDSDYFQIKVKGPMVPCKGELNTYHTCLHTDPRRSAYLRDLQAFKDQFPINNLK